MTRDEETAREIVELMVGCQCFDGVRCQGCRLISAALAAERERCAGMIKEIDGILSKLLDKYETVDALFRIKAITTAAIYSKEPPRDIVDTLAAATHGAHVAVLHGDPRRVGALNRWSWSCRCGSGSERSDMLMREAMDDHDAHIRSKGGSDAG